VVRTLTAFDIVVAGTVIVFVTKDVDVLVSSTSMDVRTVLDVEVEVVVDIVAVDTVVSVVTLVVCRIELVGVDVTVTTEARRVLQNGKVSFENIFRILTTMLFWHEALAEGRQKRVTRIVERR